MIEKLKGLMINDLIAQRWNQPVLKTIISAQWLPIIK
jgi:hypothetical protein